MRKYAKKCHNTRFCKRAPFITSIHKYGVCKHIAIVISLTVQYNIQQTTLKCSHCILSFIQMSFSMHNQQYSPLIIVHLTFRIPDFEMKGHLTLFCHK